MEVMRKIKVPTGTILTGRDERGRPVECLGVLDYGKEANIKADHMGLTTVLTGVPNDTKLQPAEEKIVVTISSQNGCSMNCCFCDVPKVGKGTNVSTQGLTDQVHAVLNEYPELTSGKRLNVHYARMGEPTFNPHILEHAPLLLAEYKDQFDTVHPVVSTMMPAKNKMLQMYLVEWMTIKNVIFKGEAGLQLSINSTNDEERTIMFSGNTISLEEVSHIMKQVIHEAGGVVGRKITLNFALAGYEIDAERLASLFDPQYFICKLTPMHVTESVVDNEVPQLTPYEPYEEALKAAGFEVIVFLPSEDEDKGRITCGNALLSGTSPEVRFEEIIIKQQV